MKSDVKYTTKEAAIAAGVKVFWPDIECKHGHISERRVRGGGCCECERIRSRARMRKKLQDPAFKEWNRLDCKRRYHLRDVDQAAKYAKFKDNLIAEGRYEEYRAKQNARRNERRNTDSDFKASEYANYAKWASKNRSYLTAKQNKRYATQRQATPKWFSELDDFVMIEAYELASDRADLTGFAWDVDHVIPLQAKKACGLHCKDNVQVIPKFFNVSKKNRMKYLEPYAWLRHG